MTSLGVTEKILHICAKVRSIQFKVYHSLSQFQHQGTITVNEEGTEAAAMTHIGFMPLSTQTRFVVDRPFLFLIYEHRTDCLVFMGRVTDPSKS